MLPGSEHPTQVQNTPCLTAVQKTPFDMHISDAGCTQLASVVAQAAAATPYWNSKLLVVFSTTGNKDADSRKAAVTSKKHCTSRRLVLHTVGRRNSRDKIERPKSVHRHFVRTPLVTMANVVRMRALLSHSTDRGTKRHQLGALAYNVAAS